MVACQAGPPPLQYQLLSPPAATAVAALPLLLLCGARWDSQVQTGQQRPGPDCAVRCSPTRRSLQPAVAGSKTRI